MRWRLTRPEGILAGVPLEQILDCGGRLPGAPGEVAYHGNRSDDEAWLQQQLSRYLGLDLPAWIILPDRERSWRSQWQDTVGGRVELGFGRAGVALALSQINKLAAPATLIAIDRLPGHQPHTVLESQLRVDLVPDQTGLGFQLNLVDGRLDGRTDVGAMVEQVCAVAEQPQLLMCPGSGSDGCLDQLMPCLGASKGWVERSVRWEFAEARIGSLGVAGSLFNWFWLYEGYRLGEWQGPAVVLDMDTSPLVGISVVDFTA